MLSISQEAMDRMGEAAYLERIIQGIASSDPAADAELHTPEGRRELCEQFEKAHTYGLTTELELGRYIVTAWLLGTDFDTKFPAMQQILTHPEMSPSQRAEAIEQTAIVFLETLRDGAPR
jgi:hypothetical protein